MYGQSGPRRGAGRVGGREQPRKGLSTLPVRTGRFVALHPPQNPTRLLRPGHIFPLPSRMDAHAMFKVIRTTRS